MATRIKASSKGQVVLPKRTRERLGISNGTELDVFDTPCGVELRPARNDGISVSEAIDRLRRMIRYDGPRQDRADWQRGIDAEIRRKFGTHLL